MPQGYTPAPLQDTAPTSLHDAAAKRWLRAVAEVLNRTINGRLTCAEAIGHREFALTRLYPSA